MTRNTQHETQHENRMQHEENMRVLPVTFIERSSGFGDFLAVSHSSTTVIGSKKEGRSRGSSQYAEYGKKFDPKEISSAAFHTQHLSGARFVFNLFLRLKSIFS